MDKTRDQAQNKNTLQIFCCAADPYQDQESVYNTRTNILICVWQAYMLRTIFIMRIKSLLYADKSGELFAASGRGRG